MSGPVDSPPVGNRSTRPTREIHAVMGVGKTLAASLDAVVRSVRTSSQALPSLLDRTLGYWRDAGLLDLEILPTGMRFDGQDVFTATEEEGRWLLPAFMAGLRALRPWPSATPEQMRILCTELSDLGGGVEALERFRDWLWADGAEGFEVSLDLSFSESMDTAFDDLEARRRALASLRVDALEALDTRLHSMSSQALDAACALPELQVDLSTFERGIAERSFVLDPATRDQLAELCQDSAFWSEAQLDVALAFPVLLSGLPVTRLAEIIQRELARAVDLRFLQLLTRLGGRSDAYSRALLQALEAEPLGHRIALGTPMTNQGIKALAGLVVSGPASLARGAARGFLERAVGERDAFAAMKQIAASVIFQKFCDMVDMEGLVDDARKTLGLLILRSRDPVRLLPKFFEGVPGQVALGVLAQAPPELLWEVRAAVARLLVELEDSGDRRQLVRIILGTGDSRWGGVLGRSLLAGHGRGWCPATLRATCERFDTRALADDFLVPLVHDPEAPDEAVLAALRSLERHPDALREATRFRLGELTHSKDVRQRIRALRRHLKEE
ncbi:MAG: hypothetical protein FJ098_05915 [Deltaproteobacteria bacterium]|nr:hypothetical protein [Deltaproteobacteria bacterium]